MDLPVRRVSALDCPSCGRALDPKEYKPLSSIECPQCGEKIAVPAQFDNYRLIRRLGHGGSGVVMEAFDERLHRRVAIKVLFSGGDADKVALEATREARALAKLNHPGIVPIHTLGEAEGHKFIVMELLDGGSARDFASVGARMSERDALGLTLRMAEALDAAHRVGLVHMDVKPGNILFNDQSVPKLIDFGAAQHARMRKEKGVVGTPYYIAPEVARGQVPNAASDIYSLGATFFHVLVGEPPFDATDPRGVIMKRLVEPAPDPRSIRHDLHPRTAEVMAKMLATKPGDRYADYTELVADLRGCIAALDEPLSGMDLTAAGGRRAALASGKKTSAKAAWAGPAIAVAVLALFAVGMVVFFGGDSGAATPPTEDPGLASADPTRGAKPSTAAPILTEPPAGAGRLVHEVWTSVPGKELAAATDAKLLGRAPDRVGYADSLAQTREAGDDYVQRFRGYVFAPQTGDYRFYVSADEAAVVLLSNGSEGGAMRAVARLESLAGPTDFTEPGEAVKLEAGKLYPIEVIHKEAGSRDHLIVGWITPDGARQTPIESKWLVPASKGLLDYARWDVAKVDAIPAMRTQADAKPADVKGLLSRLEHTSKSAAGPHVQRVRGQFRLPAGGKYTFELIAADAAQLRFGPASKPSEMQVAIDVAAPGTPDDWAKAARSNPVDLEGDTLYDFELFHVGAGPGGFFRLGLQHPDGFIEHPISPDYFSPTPP